MFSVKQWVKRKLGIESLEMRLKELAVAQDSALKTIATMNSELKSMTVSAIDLHYKGDSYVIMVGRFRNTDYVRAFRIKGGDFESMRAHMNELERRSCRVFVDLPPQFKSCYGRGNSFEI